LDGRQSDPSLGLLAINLTSADPQALRSLLSNQEITGGSPPDFCNLRVDQSNSVNSIGVA